MTRTERIQLLSDLDKKIEEILGDIQFNKDEIIRDKSPFACIWKIERETKILQLKSDLLNTQVEFQLCIIELCKKELPKGILNIKTCTCHSEHER